MLDLQIKLYSTPTCNGCRALKRELPKSEYQEYFKEINLLANEEEFKDATANGVLSVPTIGVFFKGQKFFLTGLRPIETIDEFITECIRY